MSERDALLGAVCANPDEDTPRLVFADYLDENGESERAEFIRLQIALAAMPEGAKKRKGEAREKELLAAHQEEWAEPLKVYYAGYYGGPYAHHYAPPVTFRRGFVERLSADATTLTDFAEEIFALAPIRELHFQECAGFFDLAKCEHLLRLRTLDVSGSVLNADGSDAAALFRSKYLANLTALVAQGQGDNGHLDAPGLRALANSKHLTKLERLDLSNNWMFGPEEPAARRTACRKLLWALGENVPALRELRLNSMELQDGDASRLAEQEWMSRLRYLDLSGNEVSEDDCRALCESKHLAGLEALDLTDNMQPLGAAVKRLLKKRFGKGIML